MPALPRQLPLQDEGNGAFGERCEELQEGVDKGLLSELTQEELREADQELVRYRRQARSEGVYPDIGLLADGVKSDAAWKMFFPREFTVPVDSVCHFFLAQ